VAAACGLTLGVALLARGLDGPLVPAPAPLQLAQLPLDALCTMARMLLGLMTSLAFAIPAGLLAARSRRAERVLIPVLDVLQSVPVLGFLSFTVTAFTDLAPGRDLGLEAAAVFAIFTSQAWNLAFAAYQAFRTVPDELDAMARVFGLRPAVRWLAVDLPLAAPAIVWNAMMSMSGAWFFVVACEVLSVHGRTYALRGVGAWLGAAVDQADPGAVGAAVAAMAGLILILDRALFRPLAHQAARLTIDPPDGTTGPAMARKRQLSWLPGAGDRLMKLAEGLPRVGLIPRGIIIVLNLAGGLGAVGIGAWVLVAVARLILPIDLTELSALATSSTMTSMRVLTLTLVACAIWGPVGIWIGLRPGLADRVRGVAQFMAAFPANVLYPPFVWLVVHSGGSANVWLSPLMILGAQWYVLFNAIAGAQAEPAAWRAAAQVFRLHGWRVWRSLHLPAAAPYVFTGALTAAGGCWNASIVAEAANWGHVRLKATGLGAWIADGAARGDPRQVALGVLAMTVIVLLLNRALWRPTGAWIAVRYRMI
jgi:NitT/TauT family transport system permease protein